MSHCCIIGCAALYVGYEIKWNIVFISRPYEKPIPISGREFKRGFGSLPFIAGHFFTGKMLKSKVGVCLLKVQFSSRWDFGRLCLIRPISGIQIRRYYYYLQHVPLQKIARACIFLSAKVEEQPRRLEHVINTAHFILNTGTPSNPRVYQPLDPHGDVSSLFWRQTVHFISVHCTSAWTALPSPNLKCRYLAMTLRSISVRWRSWSETRLLSFRPSVSPHLG